MGAAGAFLLACFSIFGALFVLLGFGVWAAPVGLLVASAAYIILIVQGSESLAPRGIFHLAANRMDDDFNRS